jgi:hypothetical protein
MANYSVGPTFSRMSAAGFPGLLIVVFVVWAFSTLFPAREFLVWSGVLVAAALLLAAVIHRRRSRQSQG